jgi:septal ring factor EnvC (AmiA/AmiB activator)
MSTDFEERAPEQRPRSGMHAIWYVAIALALVGNVYLLFSTTRLATGVTELRRSVDTQIAKVNDSLATSSAEERQQLLSLSEETRQSTAAALQQAKFETKKSTARVAAGLARQQEEQQQAQQQVTGQLNDLKQAASTADSKISAVSGDVTSVKADVASAQSELQKTGSDLKRVMGDMGVMSGLIATNSGGLAELRALGERNYFEFDVRSTDAPRKVGNVSLTLKKADPKRSRFTIDLLADDKRVEKRDRTINEPIQFYVAGNHQPYEIVVNKVNKNEVAGYLSTPKVKMASR